MYFNMDSWALLHVTEGPQNAMLTRLKIYNSEAKHGLLHRVSMSILNFFSGKLIMIIAGVILGQS